MKSDHKIKKVLIANRGEIALRIKRAADSLNIDSVLAVSEADKNSLAARTIGKIEVIGPPPPPESYLNINAIIAAAKRSGCDAVHPGYGFLSENADFAEAIINAGLIFIGPSPQSIRIMGSKTGARAAVTEQGVPCTPGSTTCQSDVEWIAAANKIGFPVIIKAVGGGGGRGMHIVRNEKELLEAIPRAMSGALKNFGNDQVYLERFIEMPRHVEVQVFGDKHGNIVHLGTRDCSAQRRHQKLVEEAPAPNLPNSVREGLHRAAVNAAKSVNYYNAGTVEFLVKGEEFYFLEMNTRIQVEHPVTEMVTGLDLVQLQFKVAMGELLPFTQEQVKFSGHAIEFRINAEDSTQNFRPAVGTLENVSRPSGAGIREDFGYERGDTMPPFYDSLTSKLIVSADSRQEAIYRSFNALSSYELKGIETTVPFHKWLLCTNNFQEGGIDIGFVEREFKPELLEHLQSLQVLDPLHTKGKVETLETANGIAIEIFHEDGGTFLAKPKNSDGSYSSREKWRRSNSRQAVIISVTEKTL